MREIIPFKKDILFKTKIAEITDISLSHDYKVDENTIEGVFTLSGEYKMTEASVIGEEFLFNIPFSIAIGDRIDINTINLTIENYDYTFNKDVLNLIIDMNMDYEEEVVDKEVENNTDDVLTNERHEEPVEIESSNIIDFNADEDETDVDVEIKDNKIEVENKEINIEDSIVNENTEETINNITKNFKTENDYSTYKVYIVRKDDTVESICSKYNINLDELNEYNELTEINVGDKIIIPYIPNEE